MWREKVVVAYVICGHACMWTYSLSLWGRNLEPMDNFDDTLVSSLLPWALDHRRPFIRRSWTLFVCLPFGFVSEENDVRQSNITQESSSAILVRLKSTLKLKPHSRWLIERTGRCGRAEWSWETSTTVNVRHQWSSDLTFWLYEEKSLVLAKGLLACCHQRLETNDKRLPRYPELIWLLFLFLKK